MSPIKNQLAETEEGSLPTPPLKKVEEIQIPSCCSCSQCHLNSNLSRCVYHLRKPLLKACHKEIMRQTECNRKKDKISKFFGKTFFYFVSEAIKCENNAFITRKVFQVDKSDYNSCYEKTVEKM